MYHSALKRVVTGKKQNTHLRRSGKHKTRAKPNDETGQSEYGGECVASCVQRTQERTVEINLDIKGLQGFVAIILVLVVLLIALYFRPSTELPKPHQRTIIVDKIVEQQIPIKISFSEYMQHPENYVNEKVELIGFLKHGVKNISERVGVYSEFIVDDFGQEIELRNLSFKEKGYFVKKGITSTLYKATGTFKKRYDGYHFYVNTLEVAERPFEIKKKTVQVKQVLNVT